MLRAALKGYVGIVRELDWRIVFVMTILGLAGAGAIWLGADRDKPSDIACGVSFVLVSTLVIVLALRQAARSRRTSRPLPPVPPGMRQRAIRGVLGWAAIGAASVALATAASISALWPLVGLAFVMCVIHVLGLVLTSRSPGDRRR